MITTIDLPGTSFTATAEVPGDKSLGHRALILSAIAPGTSHVTGLSDGADIGSTVGVLSALGVSIRSGAIESPGIAGWKSPGQPLDCGNSGTTMRLMAGALSGSSVSATLIGDASLSRRPMQRVAAPLEALGAIIRLAPNGTAPLSVEGAPLRGTTIHIPVPSAQVRTAVALAALHAEGATTIDSPGGYRDHTENWLAHLGRGRRVGATKFEITPGGLEAMELVIPGDPSSAAYLWAAAAVRPGSSVTTSAISLNAGRLGFLRALEAMGALVDVQHTGELLGDPVGDVTVTADGLRGISLSGAEVAATVDELPLLAVVAAAADGITAVTGAAELRAKESDRLAASVDLARLAGGSARVEADGFVVGDGPTDRSHSIDARGDHRVAMAAAVAAVTRCEPIEVEGFEACAVSWPGFRAALEGLWS